MYFERAALEEQKVHLRFVLRGDGNIGVDTSNHEANSKNVAMPVTIRQEVWDESVQKLVPNPEGWKQDITCKFGHKNVILLEN